MKNKKIIVLILLLIFTLISIIYTNLKIYKTDIITDQLNLESTNILYKNLLPTGYILLNKENKMKSECIVDNNRNINCYIKDVTILNKNSKAKYKFSINIFNVESIENLNTMKDIKLKIELKDFILLSGNKIKELSSFLTTIDLDIVNKNNFNIKATISSLYTLNKKIGNVSFYLINNKKVKKFQYNSKLLNIISTDFNLFNIKDISFSNIITDIIIGSNDTYIEYKGSFRSLLDIYMKDESKLNKLFENKDNLKEIAKAYYYKYKDTPVYSDVKLDEDNLNRLIEWAINPNKHKNIKMNLNKKNKITEVKIKL